MFHPPDFPLRVAYCQRYNYGGVISDIGLKVIHRMKPFVLTGHDSDQSRIIDLAVIPSGEVFFCSGIRSAGGMHNMETDCSQRLNAGQIQIGLTHKYTGLQSAEQ